MDGDPDKLFPYSALLEQLRKYGKFGLVTASVFLPLFTGGADSNPDMDQLAADMESGTKLKTDLFVPTEFKTALNKRMRDVVADMVKYEYI